MACKKIIEELSNYLDHELDPALEQELCRHLNHCEECRVVVDTTRKTVQIFCDTAPLELPWGVQERLERALGLKFGDVT